MDRVLSTVIIIASQFFHESEDLGFCKLAISVLIVGDGKVHPSVVLIKFRILTAHFGKEELELVAIQSATIIDVVFWPDLFNCFLYNFV